ncbi:MAG: SET domain-containing protein [Candidatus Zixiibacteriota bacterium]
MRKPATTSANGHRSNGLSYQVLNSAIQGKGVFAVRRIRKNQRLIEYAGEIISNEEADSRYDDEAMNRHHTFLFTLDKNRVIDGNSAGNTARFINHSCQPNCEAVEEDDGIWIYSFRNIQPGVELTYDYSFEHDGKLTESDRKQYPCYCGSPKCRGTILKVKRKRKSRSKRRNGAG